MWHQVTGAAYALVAFLIPFIFIYDPGILLIGTAFDIIKATAILFIGTCFLAAAMAGYLVLPLNKIERAFLLFAAIFMIIPEVFTDIVGCLTGVIILAECLIRKNRAKAAKAAETA